MLVLLIFVCQYSFHLLTQYNQTTLGTYREKHYSTTTEAKLAPHSAGSSVAEECRRNGPFFYVRFK
jgi:hypothetical protein